MLPLTFITFAVAVLTYLVAVAVLTYLAAACSSLVLEWFDFENGMNLIILLCLLLFSLSLLFNVSSLLK